MDKAYIILYWDSCDGFKRKIVRTYNNWYQVVSDITSQLSIAESQIISITLDTNVPIEEF